MAWSADWKIATVLCFARQAGHDPPDTEHVLHDCMGRGIALDVARGLTYLHSKNVIHFDM